MNKMAMYAMVAAAMLPAAAFPQDAAQIEVAKPAAPAVVSQREALDPDSSADLQAFRQKVQAAHPGMNVVRLEGEVRAVLEQPPPPPQKPPVMAIFVKNNTKAARRDDSGFMMDDQVDSIRDRLAAEAAGLNFVIMDSAEIGAAFNRYKVTTAEERAGLVDGLFTGGSVTRVAQMLGADYVLLASINGASTVNRMAGDRGVTVYTLRMTTKVLDATTGGSVYGRNWSNKRPVPQGNGDDPMAIFDDLFDAWVRDTGADLAARSVAWRAPAAYAGPLASFTVTTTLDAMIAPFAGTVDATREVKEELRVVAGGITVAVDGAAVGSSGGTFKVRPGLHQLTVTRQWMKPWSQTVNIQDGAVFNVALELSDEGFRQYSAKESLRAELALRYAEAAYRRGCKINFDTSAWQTVTWAPGADATSVSSSTMVQPVVQPAVQPIVQMPAPAAPQAPAAAGQQTPASAPASTPVQAGN